MKTQLVSKARTMETSVRSRIHSQPQYQHSVVLLYAIRYFCTAAWHRILYRFFDVRFEQLKNELLYSGLPHPTQLKPVLIHCRCLMDRIGVLCQVFTVIALNYVSLDVSDCMILYKRLNMDNVKDVKKYEEILQDHYSQLIQVDPDHVLPDLFESCCVTWVTVFLRLYGEWGSTSWNLLVVHFLS